MLATNQRIWGYETNYGGLGELTLVKASQLMPKPAHLTWEEAAVNALTNSTSYRMLVSPNGAQMTQGQTVLIWGASGGIGAYACQYVLNGGGIPVGVVSSPERAAVLHAMGVEHVIDRTAEGFRFWKDEHTQDPAEWRRLGKRIRELVGRDPDIVFEHPGRSTMGASVFVCTRGGTIVTCAATSGFMIEYDNRYLWMNQKTLKGCHFANYREAWEANRLIARGSDPSRALGGVPVRAGRRRGQPGAPQRPRGQARRAGARPRRGPRRHRSRAARPAPRPDHALPEARRDERRLMLTEIDHVAIAVNDLEAAIDFYAARLRRRGRAP